MRRKELVRDVVDLLRESNIKKSVHVPRQVLHISDNEGNSKDFTVKGADKEIAFTSADVSAVLDAVSKVVVDTLMRGDNITVHGFGSIGLQYRKPRATKKIGTDEDIVIAGRYVPKFIFGNELRMAARMYELSLDDRVTLDDVITSEDYNPDDCDESIDEQPEEV